MKETTIIKIAAIAALGAIEIAALFHGYDHALLVIMVTIIAGLAGYETGVGIQKVKKE